MFMYDYVMEDGGLEGRRADDVDVRSVCINEKDGG